VIDGGGGVKGELSYPLLLYVLTKKVISPSHLKIPATPLSLINVRSHMYTFIGTMLEIQITIILIGSLKCVSKKFFQYKSNVENYTVK
jgi:hypothetical protein